MRILHPLALSLCVCVATTTYGTTGLLYWAHPCTAPMDEVLVHELKFRPTATWRGLAGTWRPVAEATSSSFTSTALVLQMMSRMKSRCEHVCSNRIQTRGIAVLEHVFATASSSAANLKSGAQALCLANEAGDFQVHV